MMSYGVCVEDACDTDTVRVNCGTDGCTSDDLTDANIFGSCTTDSGDACDYNVTDIGPTKDSTGFTQDGICASGATYNCDTSGHACLSGGTYYDDCNDCSSNDQCDSTLTDGDFSSNGRCTSGDDTCCAGNAVDTGADGWTTGNNEDCESCSGNSGDPCDTNAADGLSTIGYCTDGDDTCCSGNAVDESANGWGSSDDLCTACAAGYTADPCDSNAGNGLSTTGYCCDEGSWSCHATGSVAEGGNCCGVDALCGSGMECSSGICTITLYNNGESCTYGTECISGLCVSGICRAAGTCDSYKGYGCSADSNAWNDATGGGVCLVDGSCDQTDPVRMNCNGVCEVGTHDTYDTCDTTSGDSCDSETGGGNFGQNGLCSSGTTNSCNTAGFVCLNGGTYYADESAGSCSEGDTCDDSLTGGDFSAGTNRYDPDDGYCDECDNGDLGEDSNCEVACGASSSCDENSQNTCSDGSPPSGYCNACTLQGVEAAANACRCNSCGTDNSAAPGSCDDNPTQSGTQDPWKSSNWAGDVSGIKCCGDGAGEFPTERIAGTDATWSSSSSDKACCNANSKCVESAACTSSGSAKGTIPDRHYCSSGTWYGGDHSNAACDAVAGSDHWNIGGDDCDPSTPGVQTMCCCEDDLSEHVQTRECDGDACPTDTSDDACCDKTSDCVWDHECYPDGNPVPGSAGYPGVTCVDGVWEDTTAPETTINPDGELHDGVNLPYDNETSFTLSCEDTYTGGSGCSETKYRIIDKGQESQCVNWGDLTNTYTGSPVDLTCPFGQTCRKKVCFASNDNAGNIEPMNISQVFHLESNACQGKDCGESCWFTPGVCPGPGMECYADGGCFLDCSVPSLTNPNDERIWADLTCGRTGSYKCGTDSVCGDSLTSCATGGASTKVRGYWTNYEYPTDSYGAGDEFQIRLSWISNDPGGFTILAECKVNKTNNDVIYFNNWGSGNAVFSYTIKDTDPEGTWFVDYCSLWSDFSKNRGWQLKHNGTNYEFIVDGTSPVITITSPSEGSWHKDDFDVNATIVEAGSGIYHVRYRWEKPPDYGSWLDMDFELVSGITYDSNASLDVTPLSDGLYNITVKTRDNVGLEDSDVVNDVGIDKTPPVFEGYDVSGCNYRDTPNKICWVKSGTTTYHEISHSDSLSTPSRQYLTFTKDGCTPDDCSTGNEIRSYVNVSDTTDYHKQRVNNTALDILGEPNGPTCTQAGGCDENMVKIEWEVLAGTGEVNHKVWTLMYDAALNGPPGYTYTEWWIKSDYTAPVTRVRDDLLSVFSGVIIPLYWETVVETGSGTDCHNVQYMYEDSGGHFSDWANITFPGGNCTTSTGQPYDFNAMDATGISNPDDINEYVFYFRSLGTDNVGNIEIKSHNEYDASTIIFISQLIEIFANNNETGKPVRDGAWFPKGKEITISVRVKDDVPGTLNITIYYSNHTRGGEPSWHSHECNETGPAEECNVTIGPFERGEVGYYVEAEGSWERSPPSGYWYLVIAEHPLCNFLVTDILRTIFGSSELFPIEVRNIKDQSDVVGLNLSTTLAKFIETNSQYLNVTLKSREEKTIYARLVPSSGSFPLTLNGNSSIDSALFDTDNIEIIIGFPADFSGLSFLGILVLVLMAGLIYLKFVKIEN